jgi:predicted MFS family arabinose efflux permease
MPLGYKAWLLASLYLAQGLPYGFFTQALPVLLREQGLSLTAISATTLLFLPWALKFMWAPLVDRLGTPKQWLLPLQLAAVAGAAALSLVDIAGALWLLLLALFLFNLVSATQDIATDGLAVNVLSPRERGLGNGIQVGGYRLGMILGGGLLLWIFARHGWATMFLGMAAMLALTVLPVLWLSAPARPHAPHAGRTPWRTLATGWWLRLQRPGVPAFIALICFYKFGNSMGSSLVGPYMHDIGMSKEQIALIKGTLGSAATLAGAAAGGWLAWRVGRRAALFGAGLLEAAALAIYAVAAFGPGDHALVMLACIAEHLLGGMAVVALFTLMMDASDPAHASTDYTVLSCALVLGHGAAAIGGALVADHAGYATLFVTATLMSVAGCLCLVRAIDRGAGPERLSQVWARRAGTAA